MKIKITCQFVTCCVGITMLCWLSFGDATTNALDYNSAELFQIKAEQFFRLRQNYFTNHDTERYHYFVRVYSVTRGDCWSCGRRSSSSHGRYSMKTRRTHRGMRCVRGVLNVQLSEMTVLMIQQTSIRMVNNRYLANSGRFSEDGGRRLVTSTCIAMSSHKTSTSNTGRTFLRTFLLPTHGTSTIIYTHLQKTTKTVTVSTFVSWQGLINYYYSVWS